MREVPEQRVRAWSPPDYTVDERGKVVGAEPGEPNNWGRWGDDDQRGTLNLLTPERVAEGATLAKTGKRFALGLPIGGIPTPTYRHEPIHLYGGTAGDTVLDDSSGGVLQVSDDWIMMALQATTQVDGLAHFGAGHLLYNGYWAGLVASRSGARRLGIHHLGDGLAGRGVLLDVARHAGTDPLEGGFAVGPDLLDATAEAQGVELRPGDIVLVRTGWLGSWIQDAVEGTGGGRLTRESTMPGVSIDALPWLAEHDVAFLAVDNPAVEPSPPEDMKRVLGLHVGALRDLGLPLGELFDLDELADDCAADGVYDGFFVGGPLPVVNGSGTPINPLMFK